MPYRASFNTAKRWTTSSRAPAAPLREPRVMSSSQMHLHYVTMRRQRKYCVDLFAGLCRSCGKITKGTTREVMK